MTEKKETGKKIRLAAIDLDGTLLTGAKTISGTNAGAIRAAMDAGAYICIATGRAWPGAKEFIRELRPNSPVITSNGAMIVHPETEEILFECCLSAQDAGTVFDLGTERDVTQIVWSENRLYSSKINELSEDYSRRFGKMPAKKITALSELAGHEIQKVLWYLPEAMAEQTLPSVPVERFRNVCIVTSDPNFLEFFSASVSKAEALRKVAGMCHVPVCETAAIGDAGNDIPMLKEAGIGIAMGNATEETKAQADAVTLDNEHDGVAYALKNICKMI